MAAVRAEVLDLVFASAVLVVFGSAVAAVLGRASRSVLLTLAGLVTAAAAAGWVVFALSPDRELAVAAGGLTVCAALELGTVVLRKLAERARDVDAQLSAAEERLEALVARETDVRAAELERTLARARADSLSRLVGEE